jgi:hypothetical protein
MAVGGGATVVTRQERNGARLWVMMVKTNGNTLAIGITSSVVTSGRLVIQDRHAMLKERNIVTKWATTVGEIGNGATGGLVL